MQASFKHTLSSVALVALLSACSSGVPLDDYGSQSRYGGASGSSTSSYGYSQSGVSATNLDSYELSTLSPEMAGDRNPVHISRVIHFEFDSFSIKPDMLPLVQGHADYLKENPALTVSLEGHTDEQGGREYNLALGQKRAGAVFKALSLMGIEQSRLEAVSFGEESPAADARTADAYKQNRRVELLYR